MHKNHSIKLPEANTSLNLILFLVLDKESIYNIVTATVTQKVIES